MKTRKPGKAKCTVRLLLLWTLGTGAVTAPLQAQRAWTAADNVPLDGTLDKRTLAYARKGGAELKLDVIRRPGLTGRQPCVMFVFGGGFMAGTRDRAEYNGFYNRMAAEGYVVVPIDYRLALKGRRIEASEGVLPFVGAVDTAVADLYSATACLLRRAGELNIDTARIVIAGSSAGALTVLAADLDKRNGGPLSAVLPPAFQYAGVISAAGAVFSRGGLPAYRIPPAPTLMFHGDRDSLVPFATFRLGEWTGLSSQGLSELFALNAYPYYYKRYEGMGHEIALVPFRDDLETMVRFIREYVLQGKAYEVNVTFRDPHAQRTVYASVWSYYLE